MILELTFKNLQLGAIVGYREKFDPNLPHGFKPENIGKVIGLKPLDNYDVEFPDGWDTYHIGQLVLIEQE